VDPVVETLKFDVPDPLVVGVTDVGFSEHVGARAGVGETEHVNDTEPLNPYIGEMATLNAAEFPDFNVALPGVAFIPKSGPVTTSLNTAEVRWLKLSSPL